MSDEQTQTPVGNVTPKPHAPNPWVRVLIGLLVFAVAGGCCLKLLTLYLASRPVDLRAHTAALTDVAEQILLNLQTPREKILRGGPQLQEDPKATWYACNFSVELAAGVPVQNVAEPFKREMAARSVSVAEAQPEPLKQQLTFSLLDHPFLSVYLFEKPLADLTAACNQIADEVGVVLQTQGIPAEAVRRSPSEKKQDDTSVWSFTRIEAPLPRATKPEELEKMIRNALTVPDVRLTPQLGLQGTTVLSVAHAGKPCVELSLLTEEAPPVDDEMSMMKLPSLHVNGEDNNLSMPPLEELPLDSNGLDAMDLGRKLTGIKYPGGAMPRVAIIVDDGGYSGPIASKVLALNPSLTIAILPYTPAGQDTARKAAELGFEVMLHVPMEPAKMTGQLSTKMSREEILEKTRDELAQIPEAVGVNNHIGSVFTADEAAITAFLEGIKDRRLFFIDSRTTAKSKAYETAKRLGIPTAMRDVFLDNESDPNYIIGQFNHLMAVAKERGSAIGVCHFRSATLPVLTQMLPQLERNGIALVHVSKLLKKPAEKPQ